MRILWLHLTQTLLRLGAGRGDKKNLDKLRPKFRNCQLANLRDRRWRRIVFCLVNPRPLRFLTCNTSPTSPQYIAQHFRESVAITFASTALDCFACSSHIFIAQYRTLPENLWTFGLAPTECFKVRDAKSGRHCRFISAILSKAVLTFGPRTDRNRNREHLKLTKHISLTMLFIYRNNHSNWQKFFSSCFLSYAMNNIWGQECLFQIN